MNEERLNRLKELRERPLARVFPKNFEDVMNNICPTCKAKINDDEFTDELSRTEYSISGMCQECQDSLFGDGDL